ncbi:MAG: glycosyltransferase [Bacteroidetes bacterium]|nr:glycosyltransferase [Bacteroidota bacterium]
MKKILYISYDGMTDSLGQSQVLPYLCGLSKLGHQITLISAEKQENYIHSKNKIEIICQNNHIDWHPIKYTKSPPVLSTLIDIRKVYLLSRKIHGSNLFDIVHCRSYISSLVGIRLKRKFNIRYIFDMRGFWVDEKIDGNIWNLKNPIFKLVFNYMKMKEREFFNIADRIVSLTNRAIPTINSIAGNRDLSNKIKVIPCCVDIHHFDRSKINESEIISWRSKLNIKSSDYIITYLGSLSTWYLPEEMLKFFMRFNAKIPQAKFLIITTEDPQPFRKMTNKIGVPEDRLLFTSSGRSELPSLLSLSNSSIFFIKPAFSKLASSPTKLGELLSMGIPVLCNTGIGDTDEMIKASYSGIICKSFNDEEYDRCTDELIKLESILDKISLDKKRLNCLALIKELNPIIKFIKPYKLGMMIRLILQNGHSSIKLFCKDNAHHLMCKSHF